MTIRIKAWGKKESWLNLVIISILVAMFMVLLRIETMPRQTESASHESFAAQLAY
jgi:competence protein ComGF